MAQKGDFTVAWSFAIASRSLKVSSRLFSRLYQVFAYRTLRVNILTLFLALFTLSFAFVISFSYLRSSDAIEEFSIAEIERVSSVVLERVIAMIVDAEQMPRISSFFINQSEEISFDNPVLTSYLLNVIDGEPNFSHVYVGSKEGIYVGANDITLSSQTHYYTNPNKPLPSNALYSMIYIDGSKSPAPEIVNYRNRDLVAICYEELSLMNYDPRLRPWYQGALDTRGLYWTDVYVFRDTLDKGVSVSYPILDANEEIIGVFGVDISFVLLSGFLAEQKIGKSGEVYILDREGKIVVTPKIDDKEHKLNYHANALSDAYQEYRASGEKSFYFESFGTKYLAHIDAVPFITGNEWLIAVVVPNSDFFGALQHTQMTILIITLSILFVSGLFVFYFSKKISSPIVVLAQEVDKISRLELASEVRVHSHIKEIMLMDASIAALRKAIRSFAKYVPRSVVKQLLLKGEEISLGGEKKEITILFTDITGFTTISDLNPTEYVMPLLSEYFDGLSKIILANEGIIDKFVGDGIMAFWGAPIETPDHAAKACMTALLTQAFIAQFNAKQKQAGYPEFFTRMAINTGTVIVGNIGTNERINYTVVGDAVNTAAHLQPVNKVYKTGIIITEATYKQLNSRFLVRCLDIYAVKGKKEKIKIYELVAMNEGPKEVQATPSQVELCRLFTQAQEAYHRQDKQLARQLFQEIHEKYPQDYPTQLYLHNLSDG